MIDIDAARLKAEQARTTYENAASDYALRLSQLAALLIRAHKPTATLLVFDQDEDTVSAETTVEIVSIRDTDRVDLGPLDGSTRHEVCGLIQAAYDSAAGFYPPASRDTYDTESDGGQWQDRNLLELHIDVLLTEPIPIMEGATRMFDTDTEAAALGVFVAHHANAIINALQLHAERMNEAAASALAAYEQGQQDQQQRRAQDTSLITNNGYRQMADLYTSEAGKCQQIINHIQRALNEPDGSDDLDHEPGEATPPAAPSLDAEEARLLRSYADGPRIWDAAPVFEIVMRLSHKGMIAPSGSGGAYALTDAGRQALTADMPSPRQCLYVFETSYTAHGYIPSMVTEGQPGHVLMTGNGEHAAPWYWGHDLAQARAIAEASNAKMGLSPADVIEIVASSHRASPQR